MVANVHNIHLYYSCTCFCPFCGHVAAPTCPLLLVKITLIASGKATLLLCIPSKLIMYYKVWPRVCVKSVPRVLCSCRRQKRPANCFWINIVLYLSSNKTHTLFCPLVFFCIYFDLCTVSGYYMHAANIGTSKMAVDSTHAGPPYSALTLTLRTLALTLTPSDAIQTQPPISSQSKAKHVPDMHVWPTTSACQCWNNGAQLHSTPLDPSPAPMAYE